MTGEDKDVKATPFRDSEETHADSFHQDHVAPEPRPGGQSSRRTERIVPRIVVAEQWLCFLFGLVCMLCGVCGLLMKFDQDAPFAYFRWLGAAHGPVLRLTAIACFVVGARF